MRAAETWSADSPLASARRRAQAWIRGPITTSTSASTSRTGTTVMNTFSGRCSSSHAPPPAPSSDAGICQRNRLHCPRSSRRYPQVPDTPPATKPTAFDIVEVTGGYPSATSVGNVMRVPEPTSAVMAPAPTPARAMRIMSTTGTRGTLSALGTPLLTHPDIDADRTTVEAERLTQPALEEPAIAGFEEA